MSQRTKLIGWGLIAAIPLALLAGVEGCVRLFDISPSFERDAAVPAWMDRNILVKDARWMDLLAASPRELHGFYGTYLWDRYLIYRIRPGVSIPLTDVLAPPGVRERTRWIFRTNGKGFPGREAAYGAHPGVYRVVAMGDSSTFGWGIDAAEAYPALVESELRSRHPGAAIEVVNLGICGYSSQQGKILLEREGLRYRPDVVTISYGSNDWSRVPEPFDEIYARNSGAIGALREALHASRAYQIYTAFLVRALRGGDARAAVPGASETMPWNVGPEKSEANLLEMVERARASGAFPVLVTNCTPGEMAGPVRRAAARSGAPLVDTASILEAAIPAVASAPEMAADRARITAVYGAGLVAENPELWVYLSDRCHPNSVGQRLLARAVASAVEAAPGFPAAGR